MSEPLPYNITLSSQTGSIVYLPSRESSIDGGWNSTYSAGTKDTGYGRVQGLGTDSHRTSRSGASMELSWIGTAVYLYGNAAAGSYDIFVDNQDIGVTNDEEVPQGGLLGSKAGLKYGNHTVKLLARGVGEVGFQYARATIGVGHLGTTVQNRTFTAVDEQPKAHPNTFFNFAVSPDIHSWRPEDIKRTYFENGTSAELLRQIVTDIEGDRVTFTVGQASAFFLYGAVNYDHTSKDAIIYPNKDGEAKATRSKIEDVSNYLDFQQILYWQSGLDPNENYTVQITNGKGSFSFNRLEIIDGGSTNKSEGKTRSLATGAIAGIAVGCVAVLGLLVAGFLFWKRYKRQQQLEEPKALKYEYGPSTVPTFGATCTFPSSVASEYTPYNPTFPTILSYPPPTHTTSLSPLRATDAGPVREPLLPPEYQHGWASETSGSTQSLLVDHSSGPESERMVDTPVPNSQSPNPLNGAAALPGKRRQDVR